MYELSELQKHQTQATSDEACARKAQGKAAKVAHKKQTACPETGVRYSQAEADLKVGEKQFEASRAYAQNVTQHLADTARRSAQHREGHATRWGTMGQEGQGVGRRKWEEVR